jgi:hypothetical protein
MTKERALALLDRTRARIDPAWAEMFEEHYGSEIKEASLEEEREALAIAIIAVGNLEDA